MVAMSDTAKVSISLPREVLQAVERYREERRETRSDFFRRAAEMLLCRDAEREADARYVRGYRENPETEDEIAHGHAAAARLAEEPWE
jgi:metal-responsive CopG/Arc/MetJ family transcriptional regulator